MTTLRRNFAPPILISLATLLTRWQHRSRLYLVPFGEIQQQVLLTVPAPIRVVVYRRLMLRIAERIAKMRHAQALVTGLDLIPHGQPCTIDLSKVTEADSAGLAVLVEWLATAQKRKSSIHYEGIPAQILAVARISDLDELLTDGE